MILIVKINRETTENGITRVPFDGPNCFFNLNPRLKLTPDSAVYIIAFAKLF